MFEDSLVESTGRIRTHAQHYAAGSLVLEATLAAILVLIPYLYPDALPRKFLAVPLIAPPPPAAAPLVEQRAVTTPATQSELLDSTLTAPRHIPTGIVAIHDAAPPGMITGHDLGIPGAGPLNGLGPVIPAPVVHPPQPRGPVHVSWGVATGQMIVPIQPRYPAIAVASRIQGTVVVAAVISKNGHIQSLRVLSGPPMLVGAAVEAIQQARYRPWKLNGEPVEVETTIHVVFNLGNN